MKESSIDPFLSGPPRTKTTPPVRMGREASARRMRNAYHLKLIYPGNVPMLNNCQSATNFDERQFGELHHLYVQPLKQFCRFSCFVNVPSIPRPRTARGHSCNRMRPRPRRPRGLSDPRASPNGRPGSVRESSGIVSRRR